MIVMKFGGTSVEKAEAIARVRSIVAERTARQPVIVVSALAGVTDSLLQLASLGAAGDEAAVSALLHDLRERHLTAARELLSSGGAAAVEIEALFSELRSLLRGLCALRELTPRLSDRIVGYGERLSALVLTAVLQSAGLKAELVDARECVITDDNFTCAVPQVNQTNAAVRKHLSPLLRQGKVPVLGGFLASNGKGVTTTLGRGGSDFTAALVGAALGAERVEIWTDVDGIRTTDPRIYDRAGHVETLSFHEAAELAQFGARVLHPATLVPAIEKNIPVYVLNSRNPAHPGTCIRAKSDGAPRVKAIAVKRGIVVLEARVPRSVRRSTLAREVFASLEQHGCTPDVAAVSDTSVTVAIDRKQPASLLQQAWPEAQVKAENSKALVSLISERIRDIPDLAAQVFGTLGGLPIRMVSQGASECSVTLVMEDKDIGEAVRRLHETLLNTAEMPKALTSRFERAIAV